MKQTTVNKVILLVMFSHLIAVGINSVINKAGKQESPPVKIPPMIKAVNYDHNSKATSILPLSEWAKINEAKKNPVFYYLVKYSDIAMEQREKYGVPASITLAQGLLESGKGQAKLAIECNNHFGIKCFSRTCEPGHCANFTDDSHKDFFRKYKSPSESFEHHSKFLQGERYKHLLKLPYSDYKNWAKGLKKAGYATDPKYASKIISIIEKYNLTQYDPK